MGIKSLVKNKKAEGFTIIEVVLVLAIAGLIFLMVFIALPGMQRSQRDTQRRDDYAALSTSVTNFMTNNNGSLPVDKNGTTCKSNFKAAGQINKDGNDPDRRAYQLKCVTAANVPDLEPYNRSGDDTIGPSVYVVTGTQCQDGKPVKQQGMTRAFSIYGQLESDTYCNSSS